MVDQRIQDGARFGGLLRCGALAGAIFLTASAPARADFFLHYWENHHEAPQVLKLGVELDYYVTKSDYDPTGGLVLPDGFNDYTRMQGDFTASYGFGRRFDLYGRFSWARAQIDSTARPGNAFGLTDQTVGLNFRALEGFDDQRKPTGFALDLQIQADIPAYDNTQSEANLTPYMGDGSTDVTGGGFVTVPLMATATHRLFAVGGAGYTYRTDDFSSAIPWSIAATYAPIDDGFYLSFSTLGLQSLKTDPKGTFTPPSGTSITGGSIGTGGSFITNAVNPSMVGVRGDLGYQFGTDVGLKASYFQTVWGQDAPAGNTITVGLEARLGNPNHRGAVHLSPQDYGRSNQGFVNYSSLEAHVVRVNDRLNLVKLDKGSQDGVEVGEVFDIFVVKKDGSIGEAIARGKITSANLSESALTVSEYYKEVWIEEGFIVKHPLSE